MSALTPQEIVQELDKHIVGQHQAKRAVAIALRNRWRRQQVEPGLRPEITPKNILMIGPTGVGKTEIARRLARLADAPFIKVEATKFTEVGYVGKDVDAIIRDLAEIAVKQTRSSEMAKVRERALDAAKSFEKSGVTKNAISLWGQTLAWADWQALVGVRRAALEALMARAGSHGSEFSTGLTYSLLQLSDLSESRRPEDAIWRSQLHYRLARFFHDRVKGQEAPERRQQLLDDAIREIGGALSEYKGAYRLPLSILLYRQRD